MTLIDEIAALRGAFEAARAAKHEPVGNGGGQSKAASPAHPAQDAQAALNAEMQALAQALEPMLSEIKGSLNKEPVAALLAVFALGLALGIAITR
jgi:hypothetical protein